MFMGQTMKTIGKFSAATFFRNFLFLAILLWHSGESVSVSTGSPSALWDCGSLLCGLWLVRREVTLNLRLETYLRAIKFSAQSGLSVRNEYHESCQELH